MSLSAVFLLLFAPFLGSFLAVLVDRLPRGEDVVLQPSACRGCGRRLGALDLVPIVSFALAKGRCRGCGAVLPGWLLYMEIAALGLAACAVAAGLDGWLLWGNAALLWLLMALMVADLVWMRLPDALNTVLLVVAVLLAPDVWMAMLGAALGAGSFWLIRLVYAKARGREGLGLGDVKLMAGLGAFAGPWDLPLLVLLASGGALMFVLAQGLLRGKTMGRTDRLPFGAALCAAGMLLWLLRAGGFLPA